MTTAVTPSPSDARTASTANPVHGHAAAFVAAHKPDAENLGRDLAEMISDPDAFAAALRAGLQRLADPDARAHTRWVAPGIGAVHGVRWPLLAAVSRGFRQATRRDPATPLLFVADRLFREDQLEPRWFAFGMLERTLETETERTWQLLRRAAREAGDWITVDSLAHPYAKGVVAEAYRWAELEQLVFSPSRWERRLVGATIATMTHVSLGRRRDPEGAAHALPILAQLIGDAEPDVQKALSWAYRSLAMIDAEATADALRAETAIAAAHADGHRAWVIRDSLSKLDPGLASELRDRLAGIRKRPNAPSTSVASHAAARFGGGGGLPDPTMFPEPPLA